MVGFLSSPPGFAFAKVFSRFGYPPPGVPFIHAHASQAQRFSRWLVSWSARVRFQFGCYRSWCPLSHAHASQAQTVDDWLPAVHVFSSSVRVLPFLEPLPSFSASPCTSTFFPALRINPRRTLASIINHQSRGVNHEEGVGWSIVSFDVVVLNIRIFDPLPDFLMS